MAPTTTPNPRYGQLKALLAQLQREETTLRRTFRETCRRMGSGDVWVGPSARAWEAKMAAYDAQVRQLVSRAIAEVEAELAVTPKEVGKPA